MDRQVNHRTTVPSGRDRQMSDFAPAAFCALVSFILYVRTLAPGVLGGDSGEFQFAAWLGGFAHPTGYPLYLILGYLWSHLLPWQDPAWRMNLFSAAWAALAVGLMYLLAAQVLRGVSPVSPHRRWLAALAALIFAVTPTFWSQAVVAEVYSLHAVFVVGVLLGLVAWAERVTEGRPANGMLMATALVYGLSLTHHRTMILLAPGILLFMVVTWRRLLPTTPCQTAFLDLGRALPLVLLPLVLYLYIPLRAPSMPYVQVIIGPARVLYLYQADLAGFLRYVTGQAFAGEIRSAGGALGQVLPALRAVPAEFTWPGVILSLIGVLWLARRARPFLLLTSVSFMCCLVFNLFYGIGDIHVYFIPMYLILALWIAMGVAGLSEVLPATRLPAYPLLALALPIYLLFAGYAQADQSQNRQLSAGWRALLKDGIPQGAILISNDRDEMTPLWYFQDVEGQRLDLTGLFPLIGEGAEWSDVGQVVDVALSSRRPVLLVKPMPGLEVKYRLEPAGDRVRVLGPAARNPPEKVSGATFGDTVRLLGYDMTPSPLAGTEATITLYWQVLRPFAEDYTTFVHLVDTQGAKIAQSDHMPGGVYYPTHLWKPGEVLVDAHRLALPADLVPGAYSIVTGLYTAAPETGLRHLGQPQEAGRLTMP